MLAVYRKHQGRHMHLDSNAGTHLGCNSAEDLARGRPGSVVEGLVRKRSMHQGHSRPQKLGGAGTRVNARRWERAAW